MMQSKDPLKDVKLPPEIVERISRKLLQVALNEMTLPFVSRIGMDRETSRAYERLSEDKRFALQRRVAAEILRHSYERAKELGKRPPGRVN